ncbi:MAG: DUF4386 domain-containing protein [Saprospiraceae bacterium]
MKSNKSIGRLAGIVFIINLVPYVIAHMVILDNLLFSENFLQNIRDNRFKVGLSVILEFTSITAMIVFAILLFPVLRKYGNRLSFTYLGLRFVEFGIIIYSIITLMTIAEISNDVLNYNLEQQMFFHLIAESKFTEWQWAGIIYMLIYVLHCVIFFYLLFKSKLVPRLISIFGFIGILLAFLNLISHLFKLSFGGFYLFAPMGLIELILAIWLIIYGLRDEIIK